MRTGGRRFAPAVLAPLLMALAACGGELMKEAPNVVFVTLDTLSLRYVTPYGGADDLTPNLDAIAAGGTLFEHAYTQVPLTLPSHTTLFSGRQPSSTGVIHNRDRVDAEILLLPEILASRGYRTGGFIALGVVNRDSGFSQGFETFSDPFPPGAWPWFRNSDEVMAEVEPWMRRTDPRPFFAWVHFSDPHGPYLPEVVEPDCELFLDDESIGKFALQTTEQYELDLELAPGRHNLRWVSLRKPLPGDRKRSRGVLTLTPLPSAAFELAKGPVPTGGQRLEPDLVISLENSGTDRVGVAVAFRGALQHSGVVEARTNYQSEVRTVDRQLGRMRDLVAEASQERETLWVIVSDHGEGLRHHSSMGHADEVFEDQLRIAWILSGPGVPANLRVGGGPVLNDSVLPTVLELLGLPAPAEITGQSLAGCLGTGSCPDRGPWWSYAVPPKQASPLPLAGYHWPYKLLDDGGELPTAYDLSADPWETNPLPLADLRERREVVSLVRALPDQRSEWIATVRPAEGTVADPEREEALRALGYLDD